MSADGRERPIEAEFREFVDGNLPNQDESPHYWWTGFVDDERTLHHLNYCKRLFEPCDEYSSFDETPYCQYVVGKHATKSSTASILRGNMSHLSYQSGIVGYERDASGFKALMKLVKSIESQPVFLAYIFGFMGHGKTDFSALMLEVFQFVYRDQDVITAANVQSDDIDLEITRYSRLVEILEERREKTQNGEELAPFVMLIDEAAQIFTGIGADQHRGKQLAKLLKLARKSNAHMLLIGQDGKDIDKALRALCTVFIHKSALTEARMFKTVKERQGEDLMLRLDGVPPTDIDFNTYDEGKFIFDNDKVGEDDFVTEEEWENFKMKKEDEKLAAVYALTDRSMKDMVALSDYQSKSTVQKKIVNHADSILDEYSDLMDEDKQKQFEKYA
ncbi:zonular occludens toxin domain-containing protein [Natronorubrum sp. DTA28]|uniref:zonular occludens toxin domain-containing protein n=1 Tax=Natronorubrum sp. DTA28 TaxID=3447019 RepID=UPI003F8687B0